MVLGDKPFAEIRIGLSTLLVRRDLNQSLAPAAVAAGVALLVAVLVAMLLAQVVLRPMHVIRSSLSRLGRGDLGATLDLSRATSSGTSATCSTSVSAQLRAASPEGAQARAADRAVAAHHHARPAHRRRRPRDEEPAQRDDDSPRAAEAEARRRGEPADTHVDIIGSEIRRLDERIQGFLKFVRPEEVTFGPVAVAPLLGERARAVQSRSQRAGVAIRARVQRPTCWSKATPRSCGKCS